MSMNGGGHRYGVATYVTRVLERTIRSYADGGPHVAGAIAFRVLFSVFPLVIVLTGVFAIVVGATGIQADVVDTIVDNVPLTREGKRDLRALLEGATGGWGGLGLLAIAGLVWSASGMMGAIRFSLNRAWGVTDTRPYFRGKLMDVLLVFAAGVLVGLALALNVGARLTVAYASSALDRVGIGTGALTWLVGFLLPAALAFFAVAFLFRVVSARRPSYSTVLPTAACVGIGFACLQALFGLYLSHFGSYNAVYGSLGAAIAFLFFVYLSASLFLLGAEAAAAAPLVREELDRGERVDQEGPPLSRQVVGFLRGLVIDEPTQAERCPDRPPHDDRRRSGRPARR